MLQRAIKALAPNCPARAFHSSRQTNMKASWNNVVIAESDVTVNVEGNAYFPLNSLKMEYFKPSTHTTSCSWKGLSNYYTVDVNGSQNVNAAWFYNSPKPAAANIKGHVAFWKGVTVK